MNGDFADCLSGWTVLTDAGSAVNALYTGLYFPTSGNPTPVPCLVDSTGDASPGSNVLVSSVHTVLPGEALSVAIRAGLRGFSVASPDTMHYLPSPPNPIRAQARIDVYNAGSPAFASAASLQTPVFDATKIEAAPFLGSLIGDTRFLEVNNLDGFTKKTYDLAPYVGETVYFAYRTSNSAGNFNPPS